MYFFKVDFSDHEKVGKEELYYMYLRVSKKRSQTKFDRLILSWVIIWKQNTLIYYEVFVLCNFERQVKVTYSGTYGKKEVCKIRRQ